MMWKENKTFQELVDEIGLDTVFQGTDADSTIKQIFLDWLFDYRLCSDDDNTFLRYFRRRFNNLYPRYLEQVRILSTRANFDPFVTEYFQDVINRLGSETNSNTKTGTGGSTSSVTDTKGSGSTTVRTPDLTTQVSEENSVSNSGTTTNSGSDVLERTGTEQIDRDGSNTLRKTGTDTTDRDADNTTTKTGTDSTSNTESATSTAESKSDTFGIAYPESNLNAIPADLSTPRSIDYANSESLAMSESSSSTSGSSSSTVTHNTTDETVIDETDVVTHNTTDTETIDETDLTTRNTEDTTTYGQVVDVENSTSGESSSTKHDTGTERTVVTNNGSDTHSTTNTNTSSETDEGESSKEENIQQEHKGRNESVADIIPRAIKAIINTNEVMWFIDSMKVCFDCTDILY